MLATLLKNEFLKFGRRSWFPMLVIFYDAILALATILFMYTGVSSYQDYVYYNVGTHLNYFLILSSIEVIFTLLMIPILVSILYSGNHENQIREQFAMIPGVTLRYTCTKVLVPVIINFILFLSGTPMLMVACIYSDTSFLKLGRLAGIILAFSFWSASITTLFHTFLNRSGAAVFLALVMQLLGSVGILFFISQVGNYYTGLQNTTPIPLMMTRTCLVLLLMNPVCSYLGFYSNLTGDISLMAGLCGSVGIDSTGNTFSVLFYKTAILGIILVAVLSTLITCWYAERTCIKSERMEW